MVLKVRHSACWSLLDIAWKLKELRPRVPPSLMYVDFMRFSATACTSLVVVISEVGILLWHLRLLTAS